MSEETRCAQIIQVDGAWLPKVRSYNFTLEDIDSEDTNRSEAGYMHRDIIRRNVYHADVVHMCTLDEMISICEALKGETTITVNVLAPGKDSSGAYAEFGAYVSKINPQLVWYEDPEGEKSSWWQVSYSLVEV